MSHRKTMLVLLIVSVAAVALGEEGHPAARNVAQMKFAKFPGFPTCVTGSVQSGDPAKGATVIASKAATGCIVPWHWHTPNEHLMIVSGTARLEPKDGKAVTLRAGGFALMPSHHVHQFRCITACTLYVYSDGAFDIHYVDHEGKEISPDDAMKAVKEKAFKPTEGTSR